VLLAVEPARLGASAQLLLDSPALNVAVSLLALGTGVAFLCMAQGQRRKVLACGFLGRAN
jgi:hypothetical protein